ncbi:hypothetical protein [Saccharopolyspora sp. NPDC049357]|uniref:hypothetical protein n=1 Tax=Saccharopolyspora sp. NPDC049357 TaxID=3154507 RepID=UPI0034331488
MSTSPSSDQRPRLGWRHIGGIAAVVFLAVIAAVAVTVAVIGPSNSEQQRPAPPSRPSAPAPPADRPPQGNQALPTAAPPVQWELVQRIAVPVSAEAGPYVHNGAVASGFQRSPVGALVAATQISTRYLVSPGDGWRQVTEQQVLPGPGRDLYMRARAAAGDDLGDAITQLAGFRFVTYSPDVAVIQLASKAPNGGLVGTTVTVRWAGGDWKLELQPNGGVSPASAPLADLTYYTAFSGVN